MMKLKKIIAAAASVVMACAFATSAFAATDYAAVKQKAVDRYPAYKDVINDLTTDQIDAIKAQYHTFDQAAAKADATQAAVKADLSNAAAKIDEALRSVPTLGVTVSDVKVTTNADGSVSVNAKVNNLVTNKSFPVAQTVVAASEHPEIGEAIKNGTWGVDDKKTAAAATVSGTVSANRVIKATGDNTAVVMLMGALAIVGVLGLAVRKSDAEA